MAVHEVRIRQAEEAMDTPSVKSKDKTDFLKKVLTKNQFLVPI
jgi:hypothetical protein